jgi:murein DD-endopeptidase MepM/ murein hydrolase activator NlpD
MARRLLLCLACMLLLAAPAAGGDIHQQKRRVDDRISTLHSKIEHAKTQEGVLTQQISAANARINGLEGDLSQAQAELRTLQSRLATSEQLLDRLNQRFVKETIRLHQLRRQYVVARGRLERRLIDAYESPAVGTIDVLLASKSMADLLDDIQYVQDITKQDRVISDDLKTARDGMRVARARTRVIRKRVATETALVRERRDRQETVTQQLVSTARQLTTARDSKQSALSSVKVDEQTFVRESQLLQAQSAGLAARIRAAEEAAAAAAAAAARAQAAKPPPSTPSPSSGKSTPPSSTSPSGGPAPSSAGLIWPVDGPIASPFGPRCLPNGDCSFHPGIDIAAPTGTPIHAAAAGTVIYAGWMEGYGNLTVIDHGNNLATAYGHQSSIGVSVGQTVAQGQVIGAVGCTGYCFGPHLHFEVRVNGEPVNPLNYL